MGAPTLTRRLLYIGVALALILLVAGALSGVFYVAESSPVPSGSAVQTDVFLLGPDLMTTWSCPTGFACPGVSYAPYGQLPDSAILPSIPRTGILYAVGLVPLAATLVVGAWFLVARNPWRRRPPPTDGPSARRLGLFGAITLVCEALVLFLTPTLLASDLANAPSGVPPTPGPWNSISGTLTLGHLTLTWGPAVGFYLTLTAVGLLILAGGWWPRPSGPEVTST